MDDKASTFEILPTQTIHEKCGRVIVIKQSRETTASGEVFYRTYQTISRNGKVINEFVHRGKEEPKGGFGTYGINDGEPTKADLDKFWENLKKTQEQTRKLAKAVLTNKSWYKEPTK